jgi:hypothetical protein
MRQLISVILLMVLPTVSWATDTDAVDLSTILRPAGDSELSDFQWTHRPVIIFADTEADPRYIDQIRKLERGLAELAKREVIVLTDTDPAAQSALRKQLRPRGFMLVLVGKDGGIKQRKPFPLSVRELSASIDKMPMREREMRERRGIGVGTGG